MAIDLAETALKENGETSRDAIQAMKEVALAMAESHRPAAKMFASPVGNSCSTASIGSPDRGAILLDSIMKDAINRSESIEVTDEKTYEVTIRELDRDKKTCKVSLANDDDPLRRYDASITDPVITIANNPYADILSSQKTIKVRAKLQIIQGDISRFFISNTVN